MIVEYICPPAILYLAFSITQIIIDMFRGDTTTAFLKFIVMIVFTVVLNLLCNAGLGIISWFIVFIPFILMTYITTVLAFVFGIPNKDALRPQRPERKSREDHERERNRDIVGGCAGTRYGCCYDGTTAKVDDDGSNCPHKRNDRPQYHHHHKDPNNPRHHHHHHHKNPDPDPSPDPSPDPHHHHHRKQKCVGTKYGCCDDGVSIRPCPKLIGATGTDSSDPDKIVGACGGSEFGCCPDGTTYAVANPCPVNPAS